MRSCWVRLDVQDGDRVILGLELARDGGRHPLSCGKNEYALKLRALEESNEKVKFLAGRYG